MTAPEADGSADARRVRRVLEAIGRAPIGKMEKARSVYGPNPCCVYCKKPAKTTDHIVARANGGENTAGNLVPACRRCNGSKGQSSLETFLRANPGTAAVFARYALHASPEFQELARRIAANESRAARVRRKAHAERVR